jgi:uncharacterized protein YkwD
MITVEEPVSVPNQAPVANAGSNFAVYTGETVNITGTGTDSDGTIVSWSWQRVSGLAVTLQNADTNRVRFTAPGTTGTIVLRLTVSDDDGATDTDDVTVTVQNPPPPPNQSPSANAGPDQTVQQGAQVTLSGSGSDPDGSIASWSWQQVSGTTVTISNANSQQAGFTAPGTSGDIRIRLTVTDDDGASDTDDVIITVESVSAPDNTTGSTLASMLPIINAARGQARQCETNGPVFPAQPPLTWSSSLATVARLHSMDMARQGYFSHTSKDGTSMGDRVFPYWSGNRVGENIAASSVNRSDSYVVDLWLNSTGHCELLMDPNMTHAGIGSGQDADNGYTLHYFWTLDFGG